MDLSKATTKELRAELHRRDQAEREERWRQVQEAFPCPECGAPPQQVKTDAVEEYRFAPRDDEGRPMLYAPYDSSEGRTEGMRYQTTIICENGHTWSKDNIQWFTKPHKGPPLLPSGALRA